MDSQTYYNEGYKCGETTAIDNETMPDLIGLMPYSSIPKKYMNFFNEGYLAGENYIRDNPNATSQIEQGALSNL